MFKVIGAVFAMFGSVVRLLHNLVGATERLTHLAVVEADGLVTESLAEKNVTEADLQASIKRLTMR